MKQLKFEIIGPAPECYGLESPKQLVIGYNLVALLNLNHVRENLSSRRMFIIILVIRGLCLLFLIRVFLYTWSFCFCLNGFLSAGDILHVGFLSAGGFCPVSLKTSLMKNNRVLYMNPFSKISKSNIFLYLNQIYQNI